MTCPRKANDVMFLGSLSFPIHVVKQKVFNEKTSEPQPEGFYVFELIIYISAGDITTSILPVLLK